MNQLRIKIIGLTLLLPFFFSVGCNRSTPPPAPLAVEELPAAFEKAFGKAKPEVKEVADQIVTAVQAKDYSKAFFALQSLISQSTLTKSQVNVATSALLTVNNLLEAAKAEGNQNAAETIKIYRETK